MFPHRIGSIRSESGSIKAVVFHLFDILYGQSKTYLKCDLVHQLHVFPRFETVVCSAALGTGYMFSPAWHRLSVFPRLAPAALFPRLASVVRFPAFGTGYMYIVFPRWPPVGHQVLVFLRLTAVTCLLALGAGCTFPALSTSYMFSSA